MPIKYKEEKIITFFKFLTLHENNIAISQVINLIIHKKLLLIADIKWSGISFNKVNQTHKFAQSKESLKLRNQLWKGKAPILKRSVKNVNSMKYTAPQFLANKYKQKNIIPLKAWV